MLKQFVDSVLIIDDNNNNDTKPLQEALDEQDIKHTLLTPEYLVGNKQYKIKHKKLVFLDLYLDESLGDLKNQISLIHRIFNNNIGKGFGAYGLVLWTKHHNEDYETFKKKFSSDQFDLPFFIVGLDKNEYLRHGFQTLFADLNAKLSANKLANFFMFFDGMMNDAKTNFMRDLFDTLSEDNSQKENDLVNTLYHLAKNHSGINAMDITQEKLEVDSIRGCSEILMPYVNTPLPSDLNIFKSLLDENSKLKRKRGEDDTDIQPEIPLEPKLDVDKKAKINAKVLISEPNNKEDVYPGNIYKILKPSEHQLKIEKIGKYEVKDTDIPIIIELTPPCDFSQNNYELRRCLGGVITPYSGSKYDKMSSAKDSVYKEIRPIELLIDGERESYIVAFNFHYLQSFKDADLLDETAYQLLFKAKDKLFADILQKFSAHAARLGAPIIH